MEEILNVEWFPKCRLCGVNGIHEMDILKIGASSGPNNSLSEKIFRCVGIRVESNDKLTTKICTICFDKINDFVVFRQICATTDIQLRTTLSNVFNDKSSVDVADDGVAMLQAVNGNSDTLSECPTIGGGGIAVAYGTITDMASVDEEMTRGMALEPSDSSTLQSADVRSAADIINWSKWSATTTDEHSFTNAAQSRSATIGTSNAYFSFSDDETEVGKGDFNTDCVELYKNGVSQQKPKTAGKMKMNNRRCFKVNCVSPPKAHCKESFHSWDEMMYHVTTYHEKGIKKTFECHSCEKPFPTKHRIRRHIRSVHIGLKQFKCPNRSCSKSFSQKGHLKQHIDSVHSGLKPFECPNRSCSKKFSNKSNLKRHIASVHTAQ